MNDPGKPHNGTAPEMSVVIPCLNEEGTVAICVRKALDAFRRSGASGEVIVVDNGSTDASAAAAEGAGARVVHESRRGYGSALLRGFREARGRYILMADADDSYDLAELPRFLDKLREGYDLVMGSRLKGDIRPGAMPALHRYLGNPVLTMLIRLMHKARISDSQCGMRAFRRELPQMLMLCSPGMEMASEIVVKAGRAGLKMTEIPISLHKTVAGRSPKLRPWRDGWRHLRLILMFAPEWLFALPGIVFICLGLALLFFGDQGRAAAACVASCAAGLQLMAYYGLARIYLRQRMGFAYPPDAATPSHRLLGTGLLTAIVALMCVATAAFLAASAFSQSAAVSDGPRLGLALILFVNIISNAFFAFMLMYPDDGSR